MVERLATTRENGLVMSRIQKILIVEPDDTLAELIAFRLELLGYHVMPATNESEAMANIAVREPDLIVSNLDLPESDGLKFIERIANDPKTSKIPVLALSYDAELDRVQRAYFAGASEYLVVPYDPVVLGEKVMGLLALERAPGGEPKSFDSKTVTHGA